MLIKKKWACKIEWEQRRYIFAKSLNRAVCFRLILFLLKTLTIDSLFLLVIRPLGPTSKETKATVHPFFSMSHFRSLKCYVFLIWAESMLVSKLHVNSSNSMHFLLLSIITRSGLREIHKMSGGIVLKWPYIFISWIRHQQCQL